MIIYTCLTNNYVDLPTHMPCGAEYYVFGVDNPPAPWKSLPNPKFISDPVRLSRYHKIYCPFDESVYVDASRLHLLNDSFMGLCEAILEETNFFVMQHPHKHTYLEECAEYYNRGWVDEKTLIEFTQEIKESGYKFNKFFSPMCTILIRRNQWHFNDLWWDWYIKGGVRDQLSFSVALQLSKTKYETEDARSFLNRFTDAEPNGIWWKNRTGDYKYHEGGDPSDLIDKLSVITGLNKTMRYRAARLKETGQLILGDRSKYFTKNDPVLDVISGL